MEYTQADFDALVARAEKLGLTEGFGFVADVLRKGQRRELSPRQWETVLAAVEREERWEAERQAKVEAGVRVFNGKGEFTGTILSIKWKDYGYGATPKVTVELEDGARLWGTLPSDLLNEDAEVGDVIRFTAQVEPADEDPTFGFFKRPRNAEFVSRVQAEAPTTLGPCGCTDYHLADCPTRTGGGEFDKDRWLDSEEARYD